MGNIHAMANRMKAISIACLATIAIIFGILAGTQCNFLKVIAKPGRALIGADGVELTTTTETSEMMSVTTAITEVSLGITCDNDGSPFYEDSDTLWKMSRVFFYVGSITLATITVLLAWILSTCMPPTRGSWRCLSIVAAVTAVAQVPVFLLFESEPCIQDINRQTCSLAAGSYFNIISIVLWVALTLTSQLMEPPQWQDDELQMWVIQSKDTAETKDADEKDEHPIPMEVRTIRSTSSSKDMDASQEVGDIEQGDDDVELRVRSSKKEDGPHIEFMHRNTPSTAPEMATTTTTARKSPVENFTAQTAFDDGFIQNQQSESIASTLETWTDFNKKGSQNDDMVLWARNFGATPATEAARRKNRLDDDVSDLDDDTVDIMDSPDSMDRVICGNDDAIRRGAAMVMGAFNSKGKDESQQQQQRQPKTQYSSMTNAFNDTFSSCLPKSPPPAQQQKQNKSWTPVPAESITIQPNFSAEDSALGSSIMPKKSGRVKVLKQGTDQPVLVTSSSSLITGTRRSKSKPVDDQAQEFIMMETATILQDLEAPMVVEPIPQ